MYSKWKAITISAVLASGSILMACNASENPEGKTVNLLKGSTNSVHEENKKESMIVDHTPKVLAAVDQPIPEAKKEVEGLPEISGLETGKSAPELAKDTSVKLKNPFTGDPEKIEAGKKKWFSFGCSGCHGGGGGGGMCPSAINEKWVYGGGDNVLFRLITLGSDQLMKQGYKRIKKESVVAPMPQVGEMTNMTVEDVWLVLTYLRSKFKGRKEKVEW